MLLSSPPRRFGGGGGGAMIDFDAPLYKKRRRETTTTTKRTRTLMSSTLGRLLVKNQRFNDFAIISRALYNDDGDVVSKNLSFDVLSRTRAVFYK